MSPETAPQQSLPDPDAMELSIRERPFRALALSAGVGFVLGGGFRSRVGVALGLFLGRTYAGTALVNTIEAFSNQNGRHHRSNQERAGRGEAKPSADRHRGQSKG